MDQQSWFTLRLQRNTHGSRAEARGMLTAAPIPAICTSVNRAADETTALIVWQAVAGDIRSDLGALGMIAAASVVISTLVNHYNTKVISVSCGL